MGTRLAPVGAALSRRLLAVEAGLAALALGRLGCAVCAGWPSNALIDETGAPWERPREWPPSLRCDSCGRTPENTIVLRYREPWPVAQGPRPAYAWHPRDTS